MDPQPCPHCGTRVIPTGENRCPSCRRSLDEQPVRIATDPRVEKRIDSLYRNVKQIPVLSILGLLVPIALLFAFPLALIYMFLRAKLLRDIDDGTVVINPLEDRRSSNPHELSVSQKVHYLRYHAARLWVPILILCGWLTVGVLMVAAASTASR